MDLCWQACGTSLAATSVSKNMATSILYPSWGPRLGRSPRKGLGLGRPGPPTPHFIDRARASPALPSLTFIDGPGPARPPKPLTFIDGPWARPAHPNPSLLSTGPGPPNPSLLLARPLTSISQARRRNSRRHPSQSYAALQRSLARALGEVYINIIRSKY